MSNTQDIKKKRSPISIQLKQEIIKDNECGARVKDLARKYGYSQSTISTILGNKRKLKNLRIGDATTKLYKNRTLIMEMERLLSIWVKEKQGRNEPLTQKLICEKALEIFDIKAKEQISQAKSVEGFRGSRGWYDRFCLRSGIQIDLPKTKYNKYRSMKTDMEKLLLAWVKEKQGRNEPLTQELICQKALEIYDDINFKETGTRVTATKRFKYSRDWYYRFCGQNGIKIDDTTTDLFKNSLLISEMEKLLLVWVKEKQARNELLTQKLICQKALEIYDNIKANEPISQITAVEGFIGSRSWCLRFCKQSGIKIDEVTTNTLIMEIDRLLVVWVKEKQSRKEPLTQELICKKAMKIYDNLIPISHVIDDEGFKDSQDWYNHFCRRSGFGKFIRGLSIIPQDLDKEECESALGENCASTSDSDSARNRTPLDEVKDFASPSSSAGITERPTDPIFIQIKRSPPHDMSNVTDFLNNNDDIESDFNNLIYTEHLDKKVEDNNPMLRTITPSTSHIGSSVEKFGDNSSLSRTIPTPSTTHFYNSKHTLLEMDSNAENKVEDEFDAFGKYVALSLRKMPTSNALSVENQIYSAINNQRRIIHLQNNSGTTIGIKMEVEDEPI